MSSERDLLVAKICIEKGFATPEHVQECLETPPSGAFEYTLHRRGYISDEALREIVRMTPPAETKAAPKTPAQIETLKRCAVCGSIYSGEACAACLAQFVQATG